MLDEIPPAFARTRGNIGKRPLAFPASPEYDVFKKLVGSEDKQIFLGIRPLSALEEFLTGLVTCGRIVKK